MIRAHAVRTVAATELRLTRRLVRFWVFVVVAFLLAVVGYLYYSGLHAFISSASATVASLSPRYLIGAYGFNYLLVFLVGVVFLGFDIRARDVRERMAEVVDSRPVTTSELVAGRFLGQLVAGWLPAVATALLIQGLGTLLPALGVPIGQPLQPWSLVIFAVAMALPAFAFGLALVHLVTLLVRHRLVAAVLSLAVLGVLVWAGFRLPLTFSPLVDIMGGYSVAFPSDILPEVADGAGWLQRIGILLVALGMVGLAAAVHPRLPETPRWQRALAGGALLLLGLGANGTVVMSRAADLRRLEDWGAAHRALLEEQWPDLERVAGRVAIDPGERLDLDLELRLRAPDDARLEKLILTLNPGMVVTEATSGGVPVGFRQADGLLELAMPLAAGEGAEVALAASGVPDRLFGYLDAARTPEELAGVETQLFLLGYERMLFDPRYVALMPGARWLPASGPDIARDDPARRPRDFFEVDLEVVLPDGWLAAGPGLRRDAGGGVVRFAPPAPVPEVALIAGRFERRAAEIDGVGVEILLHPDHTDNLEVLAEATPEIRDRVGALLTEADDLGIPYPYGGFSLVEVPNALRGFGGGWRLGTVMAAPGLMMMRESSFPTARFDVPFEHRRDRFTEREGGVAHAMVERLETFFENDFSAGNLLAGASRNMFLFQTAARGDAGLPLNFTFETLTTLLLTGTRGYFSAHMFTPELNQKVGEAITVYLRERGSGASAADAVIEAFTSRPEVWDSVLGVALAEMDPYEEPQRTVDVLTLKAGAFAVSLLDQLGESRTGELLGLLRQRYRGRTFTAADVVDAAAELGIEDMETTLEVWLESTRLPGFVVQAATTYRLPDREGGDSRYQLLVELRNGEPAAGMTKVVVEVGEGEDRQRLPGEPVLVPAGGAVQIARVFSRPVRRVTIEPYLSLNREPFEIALDAADEERIVRTEPIEGTSAVPVAEPGGEEIVVDDLDEGFRVESGDGRRGLRLTARSGGDVEQDQGIPVLQAGRRPQEWSRFSPDGAWGRYRHTAVVRRAGDGDSRALFAAELPTAKRWSLELHLPERGRRERGTWHVTVTDAAGDDRELEIDADAAVSGWNLVGTVDLPAGEVEVALSDRTDGRNVIADAIRWTPARGPAAEAE